MQQTILLFNLTVNTPARKQCALTVAVTVTEGEYSSLIPREIPNIREGFITRTVENNPSQVSGLLKIINLCISREIGRNSGVEVFRRLSTVIDHHFDC